MKSIIIKHKQSVVKIILVAIISINFGGCKKYLEVNPPIDQVVGQEIYKSNSTAASVLTGIYTDMSEGSIFSGSGGISLRTGLSADELTNTTDDSNILNYLYLNSLTNNGQDLNFWRDLYAYIFRVNSAIEGLSQSKTISSQVKQQLNGEAKFLRAFYYFYLVNLYGDVPLITTTNLKKNGIAGRTDTKLVYDQIISDLKDAQTNLSENYLESDASTPYDRRLRPNKSTATALLARVYLYNKLWQQAEEQASSIIANSTFYQLEQLESAFLINSKETIWSLQPVGVGDNTLDARIFVLQSGTLNADIGPNGGTRPVYLSSELFTSFENGDKRKSIWVDSINASGLTYPYAYKYKAWDLDQPRTENLIVFRLSEQYLIRAEARAQQGHIIGANSAASDLNLIRNRAGISNTTATDLTSMMTAILNERRWELFTEWGNRWLDLKRTGTIDQVMASVAILKGTTWQPYKALFPIPVQDIQNDPSLKGHQNPGYPEN
jgi:hypothetical protein